MSNEFSVIARRGFQSRMVGCYDSFREAAEAITLMRDQGGSLGFHIGYDILHNDKPIFWIQSYAETPEEVVDVLVGFEKLGDMTDEERLAFVKSGMEAGTIIANGEYVGLLDE